MPLQPRVRVPIRIAAGCGFLDSIKCRKRDNAGGVTESGGGRGRRRRERVGGGGGSETVEVVDVVEVLADADGARTEDTVVKDA